MHDPMVVAFDIRRPWPQRDRTWHPPGPRWSLGRHRHTHHDACGCTRRDRDAFPWWKPGSYSPFWALAGRRYYFPSVVTVWHNEPGGRDAFEVCTRASRWRWHAHHWSVQVIPAQALKRRLWTRCARCGKPFTRRYGQSVHSRQWGGTGPRWFRGELDVYHGDCSPGAHKASREA
jgi:hypothetical protein